MRNSRLACFSLLSPPRPGRASGVARLLAAFVLLAIGCSHPAAIEPARAAATLRIRNLGDFEWSVALEPVAGKTDAPAPWIIPPRGVRTVSVPAGEYRLRQTLRGDSAESSGVDESTRETVKLLGGRTYTWPLATLLTQPEEPTP